MISEEDYKNVIKNACPGPGACGGMYTANTMASAIEAMGMCLTFSSSNPAESKEKQNECLEVGNAIKVLLQKISNLQISLQKIFRECIYNSYNSWRINKRSFTFHCYCKIR